MSSYRRLILYLAYCIWTGTTTALPQNGVTNGPHAPTLEKRAWTVGQTVQTSSGPVEGHAASSADQVSEYLGIPYAAPPVGDLRFAAPVKYTGSSTINGSSFGFTCMQAGGFAGGAIRPPSIPLTPQAPAVLTVISPSTAESEDCLTLNVWTKPQDGENRKAVMAYIYGGGFNSGSSSAPLYNGQNLANQEDVVVVTLNYRLNVFGFPGGPSTVPNPALLDQRMAVEWIRDNIAAFGGDPARITLWGQSAGGASVEYYNYAWAADPIVVGFIPQSSDAILAPQQDSKSAADVWYNTTRTLNCGSKGDDDAAILRCMRAKSAEEITNTITPGAHNPVVDDKLVFANYRTRQPSSGPLLIGLTDHETGFFMIESDLSPSNPAWALAEGVWGCRVAGRADLSVAAGVPTWRYRYFGDFPNLRLTDDPPSGAWHGSELPLLFDTAPESEIANTAEQVAVGAYMRGAWAAFAKGPVDGLPGFGGEDGGWPQYRSLQKTLIRLSYESQTGTNAALGRRYDGVCLEV